MSRRGLEHDGSLRFFAARRPNQVHIMRQLLLPLIPVLALGLGANALAQNTCSTPLNAGSSLSTHSWLYLFAATDSGFNGGGSCGGEFLSIYNDTFFLWTAPSTGNFKFDNNFMGGDPELAIYRGTNCNASCVAYDSDSGPGNRSELVLSNVPAGEVFLVQVGTWQNISPVGLHAGFTVSEVTNPCNTPDDLLEENDDCASAFPIDAGGSYALRVAKTDPDMYSFSLAPGATVDADIFFWDTEGDVDLFLYEASESACGTGTTGPWLARGYTITDNEELSFTNNSGAAMELVLHVELWSGSRYHDCTNYSMVVAGIDPPLGNFLNFCDPMHPNSTGLPTRIHGSLGTGVGSGLHLTSTQGPPNQFGYYLVGSGTSSMGTTQLGNGWLCLAVSGGNSIGRYNVVGTINNSFGQFDANGDLINIVGNSTTGMGFDVPASLPLPGSPMIQSGSTWHFQLWHREDNGESNFSHGLSVAF